VADDATVEISRRDEGDEGRMRRGERCPSERTCCNLEYSLFRSNLLDMNRPILCILPSVRRVALESVMKKAQPSNMPTI
jgi:hypothetical protein